MSSQQAQLYHSVNFGIKNTWDDWKMIPMERPSVATPDIQETSQITLWTDGQIDTSEDLGSQVLYGMAEGTMQFLIMNPEETQNVNRIWSTKRSEILAYLHNRRMRMILDDDPEHYYEGRFQVEFKTGADYSQMTVKYVIDVYRQAI